MKILLVLILFAELGTSEYFSATDELKSLEINHRKLIELLRNVSEELDKKSIHVKKKLQEIEVEHKLMTEDIESYVYNPLNAFLLIKRLSHDIESLQKKLSFVATFIQKTDKIKLPSSELSGAVEGLAKLQFTYELKTEHLARGIIEDKIYRNELSPSNLLIIAKELKELNYDKLSPEYIKVARELNKQQEPKLRIEFLEKLFVYFNSSTRHQEAVEVLDEILELEPNSIYDEQRINVELLSLFSSDDQPEIKQDIDYKRGTGYTQIKEDLIYAKACRGEVVKSPKEMSLLYCRYVSKTHFNKIAPYKMIEANLDPYIFIFLDVINDDEIKNLMQLASKDLTRAKVLSTNATQKVSKQRISKFTSYIDNKNKVIRKLTERVNDFSGLNMETSENWQLQNYGIGGFYGPHHDYAEQKQSLGIDEWGNRVASVLLYLTDVEKGGGTVFPFLRVFVPPKKGSAVFWYNLSSSGNREYLTRHSGCPVIVGNKWVANKWIREGGQLFSRPCELSEKRTDEFYYIRYYDLQDYGIKF